MLVRDHGSLHLSLQTCINGLFSERHCYSLRTGVTVASAVAVTFSVRWLTFFSADCRHSVDLFLDFVNIFRRIMIILAQNKVFLALPLAGSFLPPLGLGLPSICHVDFFRKRDPRGVSFDTSSLIIAN